VNVLLTCAGRRNYLVRYFRNALEGSGQILAADADRLAPALREADVGFVVPRLDDPGYVASLVDICRRYAVVLVVPLSDLELPVLAASCRTLAAVGATTVVSSPIIVDTCLDKWATYKWLLGNGLAAPATFLTLEDARVALASGQLLYPVVVKPRWGTASLGVHRAHNAEELEVVYQFTSIQVRESMLSSLSASEPTRAVLVQQALDGDEYGLDVVNDLRGNYVCAFGRRKLGMRAGETDRAVTVLNRDLEALGQRIGSRLGHVGNLDCDVFSVDGQLFVLEMNPRFGGGYPFSHVAGANVPAALLAWARGQEANPAWLRIRADVSCAKYSELQVQEHDDGPLPIPSSTGPCSPVSQQ